MLNARPLTVFALDGRIAVHYRDHTTLANLHWRHDAVSDTLTLSTPLGQTVAVLTRDSQGVTLTDNRQHIHSAPTMEDLTGQMLGWRLPLQNLAYWIVGSAMPDLPYRLQTEPATGALQLIQSDWLITYKRWTALAGTELPANLTVSGQDMTVRLVVSNWRMAQ